MLYLIEEEKLAHDVYTELADKWGARVFSNILESVITHEEWALSLLQARDIADPRSGEIGVFVDPELQALYDQPIASENNLQAFTRQLG